MNQYFHRSGSAMFLFACMAALSMSGCETKNSDNQSLNLLALIAPQTSGACVDGTVAAIASSNVTTPRRTQYCVGSAAFNAAFAGTTSILSNTNLSISDGGVNDMSVEVTFTLPSGGSLDVFTYATAVGNGPAVRFNQGTPGSIQYSKDGVSFSTFSNMAYVAPTLSAGTSYTYCIDFDVDSSHGMNAMFAAWPGACSGVSSSARGTMGGVPIMKMNPGVTVSGQKVGFALNGGSSVSSFILGTRIYNAY